MRAFLTSIAFLASFISLSALSMPTDTQQNLTRVEPELETTNGSVEFEHLSEMIQKYVIDKLVEEFERVRFR